mmetsp:Transcript_103192/g.126115  ORF Transcript_103192/g.126115 Transcript_103192/m.126115 type:complete len:160 (+) Transcript_103192:794-1273(+)
MILWEESYTILVIKKSDNDTNINTDNGYQHSLKTVNDAVCYFDKPQPNELSWVILDDLIIGDEDIKVLSSGINRYYNVTMTGNSMLTTDRYNDSYWYPYGGHLTLKIKNKLILRDNAKIDLNQLQSDSQGGTLTIFAFSVVLQNGAGIFSNGIINSIWG